MADLLCVHWIIHLLSLDLTTPGFGALGLKLGSLILWLLGLDWNDTAGVLGPSHAGQSLTINHFINKYSIGSVSLENFHSCF
jgi:hypothetical protein